MYHHVVELEILTQVYEAEMVVASMQESYLLYTVLLGMASAVCFEGSSSFWKKVAGSSYSSDP